MPRPVGFPGLTTTLIDSTSERLPTCSRCSASRAAMLNSSEPQKRIRRGSEIFRREQASMDEDAALGETRATGSLYIKGLVLDDRKSRDMASHKHEKTR